MTLLQDGLAPPRPARTFLRPANVLWCVLGLLVVGFLASNVEALRSVVHAVAAARPEYLLAALAVQALFFLNLARSYVTAFRASGLEARTPRFVLLTSAAYFLNLVSNTTGLAGIGIYLREGRRTGQPLAAVTAAYMTVYVLGYAAFFIALGATLVLLIARGSLTATEVAASAVVGTFFAVVALIAATGLRSRTALEGTLVAFVRPLNSLARRFLRRPLLAEETVREGAGRFYETALRLKQRPARFLLPLSHAVAVELLSALLLFLVARALGANIGFEVALAGYVLSLLFSLVSITPGGIGFAEASLAVLLVSFGVAQPAAIAIALVFRLFDFWLPAALGALSLAFLGRRGEEART